MPEFIVGTPLKHSVATQRYTFADAISIQKVSPILRDISIAKGYISQHDRAYLSENRFWLCATAEAQSENDSAAASHLARAVAWHLGQLRLRHELNTLTRALNRGELGLGSLFIRREPNFRGERFAVSAMAPALHCRPKLRCFFPPQGAVQFRQEGGDWGSGQFPIARSHHLNRGLISELDNAVVIDGYSGRRARLDQHLQSFPPFQSQPTIEHQFRDEQPAASQRQ